MNNKTISMILSIVLIVVLSLCAYGWMQTMPSAGENVEYNRNFYICSLQKICIPYIIANGVSNNT